MGLNDNRATMSRQKKGGCTCRSQIGRSIVSRRCFRTMRNASASQLQRQYSQYVRYNKASIQKKVSIIFFLPFLLELGYNVLCTYLLLGTERGRFPKFVIALERAARQLSQYFMFPTRDIVTYLVIQSNYADGAWNTGTISGSQRQVEEGYYEIFQYRSGNQIAYYRTEHENYAYHGGSQRAMANFRETFFFCSAPSVVCTQYIHGAVKRYMAVVPA